MRHPKAGYLYGTVTSTQGKSYTGLLRWGGDEAFWGDLFQASKAELPYLEEYGGGSKPKTLKVFGRELSIRWGRSTGGRQLAVPFGQIARIEVDEDDEIRLVVRDGSSLGVKGSGDARVTIEVRDASLGEVKLPWKSVRRVELSPTPADVEPPGFRLHGTVTTSVGAFTGFIRWDRQESLSIEELDGEEDDIELSIEMGHIRSIEKRGNRASQVVLKDGRSHELSGTNDVNDENRGIVIEDVRFGRVVVPWRVFERLELTDPESSGPGYDEYSAGGPLLGVVTTADGAVHRGRVVWDLDEAYTWEILDGEDDKGLSYTIPFALVASIEPVDEASSRVTLLGGEELLLSDGQDVSDDNDGVLVIPDSGEPVLVEWRDLRRLELERPGQLPLESLGLEQP